GRRSPADLELWKEISSQMEAVLRVKGARRGATARQDESGVAYYERLAHYTMNLDWKLEDVLNEFCKCGAHKSGDSCYKKTVKALSEYRRRLKQRILTDPLPEIHEYPAAPPKRTRIITN